VVPFFVEMIPENKRNTKMVGSWLSITPISFSSSTLYITTVHYLLPGLYWYGTRTNLQNYRTERRRIVLKRGMLTNRVNLKVVLVLLTLSSLPLKQAIKSIDSSQSNLDLELFFLHDETVCSRNL
jgi:hypothetical protein